MGLDGLDFLLHTTCRHYLTPATIPACALPSYLPHHYLLILPTTFTFAITIYYIS